MRYASEKPHHAPEFQQECVFVAACTRMVRGRREQWLHSRWKHQPLLPSPPCALPHSLGCPKLLSRGDNSAAWSSDYRTVSHRMESEGAGGRAWALARAEITRSLLPPLPRARPFRERPIFLSPRQLLREASTNPAQGLPSCSPRAALCALCSSSLPTKGWR